MLPLAMDAGAAAVPADKDWLANFHCDELADQYWRAHRAFQQLSLRAAANLGVSSVGVAATGMIWSSRDDLAGEDNAAMVPLAMVVAASSAVVAGSKGWRYATMARQQWQMAQGFKAQYYSDNCDKVLGGSPMPAKAADKAPTQARREAVAPAPEPMMVAPKPAATGFALFAAGAALLFAILAQPVARLAGFAAIIKPECADGGESRLPLEL